MWSKGLVFLLIVPLSYQITFIGKRERPTAPLSETFIEFLNGRNILPYDFPYDCAKTGQYPDPYDCRSYFVCNNMTSNVEFDNATTERINVFLAEKMWFAHDDACGPPRLNDIFATEYCTCPDGTYWGGPAAGCVKDDIKDMEACCNFKPNCNNYIYKGEGGDFGSCSLSSLGYSYTCFEKISGGISGPLKIRIDKCKKPLRGSRNACLPDNDSMLDDDSLQAYPTSPTCYLIKHFTGFIYPYKNNYDWIRLCMDSYSNPSPRKHFPDDSKLQLWSLTNNKLIMRHQTPYCLSVKHTC